MLHYALYKNSQVLGLRRYLGISLLLFRFPFLPQHAATCTTCTQRESAARHSTNQFEKDAPDGLMNAQCRTVCLWYCALYASRRTAAERIFEACRSQLASQSAQHFVPAPIMWLVRVQRSKLQLQVSSLQISCELRTVYYHCCFRDPVLRTVRVASVLELPVFKIEVLLRGGVHMIRVSARYSRIVRYATKCCNKQQGQHMPDCDQRAVVAIMYSSNLGMHLPSEHRGKEGHRCLARCYSCVFAFLRLFGG